MFRIKICGINDKAFALKVCNLGIDALGFNFYKGSIRYIEPVHAKHIINALPPFVSTVGVFVNSEVARILDIARDLHLDYIQLHGDEGEEFAKRLRDYKVIKAIHISDISDIDKIPGVLNVFDYVLLDTKIKGKYGGSGRQFNRQLLSRIEAGLLPRIIVAGGINPTNAGQLRKYDIFAIDINSGIETSPGVKDAFLLKKLLLNAQGEKIL